MPVPQKKSTTLQLSKPKPVSANEKRIIAGGDTPQKEKLISIAVYVDRPLLERIDKACGKGYEIGMNRSMWVRGLILRELEKKGI